MARRALAVSVLLASLLLPATAPVASAVVCDPEPECLPGVLAEAAHPALEAAARAYAAAAPWLAMAEHYGMLLLDPVLPDSDDGLLLVGTGLATVRLASGVEGTCSGDTRMVLEASRKSFRLEPTVTMSYGGGQGAGSLAFPCAQGEARQPTAADIVGPFSGAWSAERHYPNYQYRIEVSAPLGDGTRHVSYVYEHLDGTRHAFEGILAEHR